jgi:SPP1 gp7 family putative phage head morphogenesis protein
MMKTPSDYEQRAVLISAEIYMDQIKEWNQAIRQQMTGFRSRLSLPPVSPSFQKVLEKAMMLSYLMGAEKVFDKVAKDKAKAKAQAQAKTFADEDNPYSLTTFDEAVRMLKNKGVVTAKQFKAASASIKAASFSVQRIERMNAIIAIKESLLKAAESGLVFDDWLDLIGGVWDAHGVTPLSMHHLETVYRTNMGSTYEIASDEATRDDPYIWGYEYSGIADGRESEICRPFFGVIKAKDDPFWSTARPLNHYNCRCTTISLTQYDAEVLGIKETPGQVDTSKVHDDFKQNARTMDDYNKQLTRYAREKEQSIAELDNKLLEFKT